MPKKWIPESVQNRAWALDAPTPTKSSDDGISDVAPAKIHVLAQSLNSANNTSAKLLKPTTFEVEEHPSTKDAVEGECQPLMYPRGLAIVHPAGPLLLRYKTRGFPVECGRPWSKDEIATVIEKGSHISALEPDADVQFRFEAQ